MISKMKYRRFHVFCILLALTVEAKAAEDGDWTVLTVSRGGAFGVFTHASLAMAIATTDCKATSLENDCGAEFRTVRRGWILYDLCGDHRILGAAASLDEAEAQMRFRIELKRAYIPNWPSCRRVFAIDPNGWFHCRPNS
jgi:hypothetical protein